MAKANKRVDLLSSLITQSVGTKDLNFNEEKDTETSTGSEGTSTPVNVEPKASEIEKTAHQDDNRGGERFEKPLIKGVQKVDSITVGIPEKLKKLMKKDDDLFYGQKTTNISIHEIIAVEFNHIRDHARSKVKTSQAAMINNILYKWLVDNADVLEKSIGYRPLKDEN